MDIELKLASIIDDLYKVRTLLKKQELQKERDAKQQGPSPQTPVSP